MGVARVAMGAQIVLALAIFCAADAAQSAFAAEPQARRARASEAIVYKPRPLTIRRSGARAIPTRPPARLRARDLICPRPNYPHGRCLAATRNRPPVPLLEAPGAEAFRLGSSQLSPPRVPPVDATIAYGSVAQAIIAAQLRPPVYPDLYARAPVFGVGQRPPIYPGVYGLGYGYYLPTAGGRAPGLGAPVFIRGGVPLPRLPFRY